MSETSISPSNLSSVVVEPPRDPPKQEEDRCHVNDNDNDDNESSTEEQAASSHSLSSSGMSDDGEEESSEDDQAGSKISVTKDENPPSSSNNGQGESSNGNNKRTIQQEKAPADRFPERMYDLLEYASHEGHESIISWEPDGKSFCIRSGQALMTSGILLRFFPKQTKCRSFDRLLNLWGFIRLRISLAQVSDRDGRAYASPRDAKYYGHVQFVRGDRERCRKVQRVQQAKRDKASQRRNGVSINQRIPEWAVAHQNLALSLLNSYKTTGVLNSYKTTGVLSPALPPITRTVPPSPSVSAGVVANAIATIGDPVSLTPPPPRASMVPNNTAKTNTNTNTIPGNFLRKRMILPTRTMRKLWNAAMPPKKRQLCSIPTHISSLAISSPQNGWQSSSLAMGHGRRQVDHSGVAASDGLSSDSDGEEDNGDPAVLMLEKRYIPVGTSTGRDEFGSLLRIVPPKTPFVSMTSKSTFSPLVFVAMMIPGQFEDADERSTIDDSITTTMMTIE